MHIIRWITLNIFWIPACAGMTVRRPPINSQTLRPSAMLRTGSQSSPTRGEESVFIVGGAPMQSGHENWE